MANPSLQIGNSNWAIKEDNLLGYSTAGTRFLPQPITMTRASAGTRVNSSGLVETVELLGSEVIVNGDFNGNADGWALDAGVIYGDNNIIFNTPSNQKAIQTQTFTIGKTYKVSINLVAYTSGTITVRMGSVPEVIDTSTLGVKTWYIVATGNLARIEGTFGVGVNATVTNVSVKESTKNNLARVDYDGTASSLLVEPERTNLITYSEDYTNAIWIKVKGGTGLDPVITSNYTTSPDGTLNASRIIFDAGTVSGSNLSLLRTNVSGLSNPHSASISFYLKSNTASNYTLIWYQENLNSTEIIVTPTWQRYTLSSAAITNTNDRLHFGLWDFIGATSSSYADISIWGAQLEVGSYPTSYIPTSGSTVTRVKDQYEKTGISNLINSEEGVLFAEIAALSDDLTDRYIMLSDGGWNNRVQLNYENVSNTIEARVFVGSFEQFDTSFVLTDITLNNKFAIKWKVNDFALWVNGVEVDTDSSGSVPSANTLNELSFKDGQGSNNFYGKVKQLQVYKTADIDLAALTS